jgi:hypothetical protein
MIEDEDGDEEDSSDADVVVVVVSAAGRLPEAGTPESPLIPKRAAARPSRKFSRIFCTLSWSTPSSVAAWATPPSTCPSTAGSTLWRACTGRPMKGLSESGAKKVSSETTDMAAATTPALKNTYPPLERHRLTRRAFGCARRGGGLSLFTELPRGVLLGNPYIALPSSRIG